MKEFIALNQRLTRAWWDAAETTAAASATIAARLPLIAAASTGFGDRHARGETQEMVAEKLKAVAEGAQASAMHTARATISVMLGEAHPVALAHPTVLANHMMDVAEAATAPASSKSARQRQTAVAAPLMTDF